MSDSNRGALAKIGRLVLLWGLLGALTVAASALTVGWGLSVRAVDQQTYPIPSRECAADKSCEQKAVQIAARQAAIDDTAAMFALYQLALSVAGFVGLGLTFFYAHKAWKEAQRSADTAERALIADKRAFVFATGVGGFFESENGGYGWRLRPQWKNTGDTPTRKLRLLTNGALRNAPLPPIGNREDGPFPAGVGLLGPDSTSMGGLYPPMGSPPLSAADILDIQSGRKFLYLWGWVRYFDVFDTAEKDEHITRFCWQMVPGGDPVAFNPLANPPDGIKWDHISHATGNCADDECKDHG